MIRRATLEDMDWLIDLAREKYGVENVNEKNDADIRTFLSGALSKPWVCVARGDFGAGMMTVTRPFYEKNPQGHLLFIVSRSNKSMEGYKLARALTAWAFAQGASHVHVSSETAYDLAPFARRLGAVASRPSYVIRRPEQIALERAA